MIEKIYDLLCVPKNSRLKSRIAFNQIFKAFSLTIKEQKEISNNIDKIYLIAEVNSRTCNYHSVKNDEYVYETIQYIYIELTKKDNIEWLDEMFHKIFPNPIIIIYSIDNEIAFSTSLKRLNKVENNKVVIENIYNTTFDIQDYFYNKIKDIMNNKKITDLFKLYKELDDTVYMQMLYQTTNKFKYNISIERIKELYLEIEELKKENRELNIVYNKEKNQAKRMELYMKIKINNQKIEDKIKEIEV